MGKPPTCIPRSVLLFLIPGSRTLCTGSSPIPIERARDYGAGVTAEHTSESCFQLCLCGAVGIEVSEPRVHVWMPKLTSRLPEALSFILLVTLGKRPPHAHIVGILHPPIDQVRPTLCKALDQWAPGKRREHVRDRPGTPSPYIWQSSEGHTPLIGSLVPPFFTHN